MADKSLPSASEPVKNIVLVGRTGNGKSATGNTLLGDKQFTSKKQAGGVTMKCKMLRTAAKDGPLINVIDTPGLFDGTVTDDILCKEIVTCLSMAEEGIHAVLFVLSTKARISEEEERTLNALQRIFECKILDYFIVLFTGGDELEDDGMTLDDYLSDSCPEFLRRVLRLCGGRKVLFNNKTTDKDKKAAQLNQLLAHIADVELKTGGKPYTDNMHRKIKEENDKLREQEREINSKNLAEAELKIMHEKLQMEHEKNMNIMALAMESTLNQNAEIHEKQIRRMEDAIKLNAEAHEREIRQMRDDFQQGALKQNAAAHEAHEKEMRLMRDEFQQAQQRQLTQQLQQAQQFQQAQQLLPARQFVHECSIM